MVKRSITGHTWGNNWPHAFLLLLDNSGYEQRKRRSFCVRKLARPGFTPKYCSELLRVGDTRGNNEKCVTNAEVPGCRERPR